MDAYIFEKRVSALQNNPNDVISLRLIILGIINNIMSNHRDAKKNFLSIIRNLTTLYKKIPNNNTCSEAEFATLKNNLSNEIVAYNIRPFLYRENAA